MKNWAFLIAALYAGILFSLTVPAILLAFAPHIGLHDAAGVYQEWAYWLWLAVMAVSQFALLAVPVRVASRRPVSRGPVWRTLLAAGLMAGGMAAAACLALYEFFFANVDQSKHNWDNWASRTAVLAGLLIWGVWAVIFARMSRRAEPGDVVSRQCRWLFRGSVLELLIAVPTHIVVRCRDYCCAGILTFLGLTMGFSVMLFAFGPALLFLFVERWKRLHPESRNGGESPSAPVLSGK